MTFPAILSQTASLYSALAAFAVGVILSWRGSNLMIVSLACCLTVYLFELFL